MAASSPGARAKRAALGLLIPSLVGCAIVPRTKLEESQAANRELRTQLAEAKDSVARLKTQNRDLATRSMEESRRNLALEEANQRFERDIMTYQEEREQYAAALDQIKAQVMASSSRSRPTAGRDPIGRFVADYAESTYDEAKRCLSVASNGLFAAGGTDMLPKAKADLEQVAKAQASAGNPAVSIRILGQTKPSTIRRVSTAEPAPTAALSRQRIEVIQKLLRDAGLPAKAISIAE